MEQFGLKSSHVNCLYYLYKNRLITAARLSELTKEDKAGISRSLNFLEKKGLINCNTDSAKKYNNPIKLTELGEEVGKTVVLKIDKYIAEISGGLNDDDREILYRCLNIISENIDKIATKIMEK